MTPPLPSASTFASPVEFLPPPLVAHPLSRAPAAFPRSPSPPPAAVLAFDPLWAAARRAEAEAADATTAGTTSSQSLAQAWQDLVRGRVTILCESVGVARAHLLACLEGVADGQSGAVSPADAALVVRLLGGQAQKVVASELGIAASTASRRYLKALRALGLPPRAVPLPLVLAAQAQAGGELPTARSVAFEHHGWTCLLFSIPRPRAPARAGLTFAEREAAHLLIEGCSATEIARRRSTSVPTAMRQAHAVFSKMGVTGRHALIRRAVERDWFR